MVNRFCSVVEELGFVLCLFSALDSLYFALVAIVFSLMVKCFASETGL